MKSRSKKILATSLILALLLALGGNGLVVLAAFEPGGQVNAAETLPNPVTPTDAQRPNITTQPPSVTASVNDSVTLAVTAAVTDGGTLSWQWFINTTESNTGGSPINGAVSASFAPSTRHEGTLFYYVVVTNINSSVTGAQTASITSNTARVTVNAPARVNAQTPGITSNPRDGSVMVSEQFTLSITAEVNDGGTLSYQWFRNTNDRNSGGTPIRGATSRTYTPPTGQEGTVFYYVEVTNTNNNVNGNRTATIASGTAKVTVNTPVNAHTPNIIRQPEGGIVKLDGSIVLSVIAEIRDAGTLSYQWFRNTNNDNTGGTAIRGATGTSYTPDTDIVGVMYYYVEITNTNNNATGARIVRTASAAVAVNISTTPDAPQNLTATAGADYVVLNWEAPEDDGGSEITHYQISDNIVTFWVDANGEYEHIVEGLNSDTEYIFRVRAVNFAGHGEEAELTVVTEEPETVYVTGVSLEKSRLDILVGDIVELSATLSPEDADDTSVTWESDDTEVATVDRNGVVTALERGTAIITVTTNDGGYTASVIVTVENVSISPENLFLWIGLGSLAPLGAGTGVYFWRRNKR